MKLLLTIILFLACMPVTTGHMIIEEVLYDPASESGGEAVLLYNPDNASVDLSGWTLATETSAADATLPPGFFLAPFATFLVADAGWELHKGDLPSADYEESLTLTNTNAGIALKDASGVIIDAVGWGVAAEIKEGLFEGTPHNGTKEGFSLRRMIDTDDNLVDFIAAEPSFMVIIGGTEIPVELDVDKSDSFVISNVTLPAVFAPEPGKNRTLLFALTTTQPADVTITGFNATIAAETEDGLTHTASFVLPYWQAPGNYTLFVTASNGTTSVVTNQSVTVSSVTSIGLDAISILAASLVPGSAHALNGDTDMNTPEKPTLINNGNTIADVVISATVPAKGSLAFALSNIKYGLGMFNATVLKQTQLKKVRLAPRETLALNLWITVPMLEEGRYEGSLTIAGKEAK